MFHYITTARVQYLEMTSLVRKCKQSTADPHSAQKMVAGRWDEFYREDDFDLDFDEITMQTPEQSNLNDAVSSNNGDESLLRNLSFPGETGNGLHEHEEIVQPEGELTTTL